MAVKQELYIYIYCILPEITSIHQFQEVVSTTIFCYLKMTELNFSMYQQILILLKKLIAHPILRCQVKRLTSQEKGEI